MFLDAKDLQGMNGLTTLAGGLGAVAVKRKVLPANLIAKEVSRKRQADLAKKLGLPTAAIGGLGIWPFSSSKLGPSDDPWTYEEFAAMGYSKDQIAKMFTTMKVASWDYERNYTKTLITSLLNDTYKVRAGVVDPNLTKGTGTINMPSPEQAGSAKFWSGVKSDVTAIVEAPANAFNAVMKYKWYILGGVGALGLFMVWPYISAVRSGGKALSKAIGG